jgi:hypothetical protein
MNLFNHLILVIREEKKKKYLILFRIFYFSALNAYRQAKDQSKIDFVEEKIIIPSYANVWSVLFNQNFFGFNRDRNGANW